MHVHILQFASREEMIWAFGHVLDTDWVESCVVDPAKLQLRFRAEAGPAGPLIERIYRRGGLTWVSRHAQTSSGPPSGIS